MLLSSKAQATAAETRRRRHLPIPLLLSFAELPKSMSFFPCTMEEGRKEGTVTAPTAARRSINLTSITPLLRPMMRRAGTMGRSFARAFLGGRNPSSSSINVLATLMLLFLLSFLLILLLLAFRIYTLPVDLLGSIADAEFIPEPRTDDPRPRTRSLRDVRGLGQRREQWTEVISWQPRALIYHNFLSKEECEYLIELAKPHLKRSEVTDSGTGKSRDSRHRTSSGMFIRRGKDKTISTIEERIANYTFIPVGNGEGLQVLRYAAGQKYDPHYDFFFENSSTKNGGQRMATLLMYLSDVEEGGETIFPEAIPNITSSSRYSELSECGRQGLAVKPKMGDALLFYSLKPDATLDFSSLHGACPVIMGNKWSATKWMHVDEFKYS